MSWEKIKNKVRKRDGLVCQNCGIEERENRFHVHHVVPRSEGGIDVPENLVLLCPSCHSKLEGTRIKPEYLGNTVRLRDEVESLQFFNVLRFVEKEICNRGEYFNILFIKDEKICNRCLSSMSKIKTTDFPYSKSYSEMLKEFLRISLKRSNVESVMDNRSLFYDDVEYICDKCGGRNLKFSNDLTDDRFYEILKNVEKVLSDKSVNYSEEILYGTAKRMYILPHNQCRERRVLQRAVNYSIEFDDHDI